MKLLFLVLISCISTAMADPQMIYYNGCTNGLDYRIGLAIGDLGLNAVKYSGNPVLNISATGWDNTAVKDPDAIRKNGQIWLYYSGYNSSCWSGIGLAKSSDGKHFIKYSGNPILQIGSSGAWDDSGIQFPRVWYDDARSKYYMVYMGHNHAGVYAGGLAYSTDCQTWTKFAGNPILTCGSTGTWDDAYTGIFSNPVLDSGTWKILYGGRGSVSDVWQTGLASFTDPEGTWTKYAGNPVIAQPTAAWQHLTQNITIGTKTVHVADTSPFHNSEPVLIWSSAGVDEFNRVASIDSGTQLTLASNTIATWTTGDYISSWMARSNVPATLEKDGNTWKMWGTAFQVYGNLREISNCAISYDGTTWTNQYAQSPPVPFSDTNTVWDGHSSENPCVLPALTTAIGNSPLYVLPLSSSFGGIELRGPLMGEADLYIGVDRYQRLRLGYDILNNKSIINSYYNGYRPLYLDASVLYINSDSHGPIIPYLPSYASNAAAISAGLATGTAYRNSTSAWKGLICTVY